MVKKITLSLVTILGISASPLMATDSIADMFKDGKASGQIRAFYIDREYQGSAGNKTHRGSSAIGGYLKYDTAPLYGLSLGVGFYTTNEISSRNTKDMTLFGKDNDNYSMLGEAYVNYKYANTTFKGGRQRLSTPMLSDDDARMLPNLFEAYVLTNKDIKDTTISIGHVNRFAQGTFGRAYDPKSSAANAILSATSGYSYVDTQKYSGEFVNIGKYAFGKSTSGITMANVTYSGIDGIKLDLWDYYAHDIANIIYAEANFAWKCLISDAIKPYAGVQYIQENSIKDEIAGDIDSKYIAAKLGFKVSNFDLMLAYSKTGKNDSTNNNNNRHDAILSPWGGMSAYTQGMVTRHQYMAGTEAKKVSLAYNFKDLGVDLTTLGYYSRFDMDKNSGYGISRDASEAGFDLIHNVKAVQNLQVRFRGNFPRGFAESATGTTGWDEYRFIVNYNF